MDTGNLPFFALILINLSTFVYADNSTNSTSSTTPAPVSSPPPSSLKCLKCDNGKSAEPYCEKGEVGSGVTVVNATYCNKTMQDFLTKYSFVSDEWIKRTHKSKVRTAMVHHGHYDPLCISVFALSTASKIPQVVRDCVRDDRDLIAKYLWENMDIKLNLTRPQNFTECETQKTGAKRGTKEYTVCVCNETNECNNKKSSSSTIEQPFWATIILRTLSLLILVFKIKSC